MRGINSTLFVAVTLALLVSVMAMSQQEPETLVVNGYAGSVPLVQMNGRRYVEVDSLARMANGSLRFVGKQIVLTLLAADRNLAGATKEVADANTGFSKEFLRTGIEGMSTIREWHSVLTSAIENQYPITEDGLRPYQADAITSLGLIQAAAITDSDKNAAQLVAAVYQKMELLSDKYVKRRADMTYIEPNSLRNDPLNEIIVACGRALGAMAANRQFLDAPECH